MNNPVHFSEINGIRTAESILGEGPAVLMLHGWGADLTLLQPLAQKLAPLGYRVYMLDLPGFGQSAPPPQGWSVHDYANYVIAYMDYHNLESVYLFGHSFGGRLSLVLGAKWPERLIKITLAGSAGVRPPSNPNAQFRLKAYRFALNSLQKIGLSGPAENLRTWYNNRYASADYKAAQGVMRETFVKVVNEDLLPYAAQIKAPTLLFWGDQDADTPLWQGQRLEQTIPDAGLVVYEGAGHYCYLDRADQTARVMDHFFKQGQ
jgi:pimeloyl-ACP methyl ester carboxylesterase